MIDSTFSSTSGGHLVKESNKIGLGQLINTMACHFCKEIRCIYVPLLYMYKFINKYKLNFPKLLSG